MIELGLAHLTALQLAPAALIAEAARAGFAAVGLRFIPASSDGPAYPTRVGTEAHRALKRVLIGEGVRVSDIELVQLKPTIDLSLLESCLEAGADLGATAVIASGDDPDLGRLTAHFAELCQLAASFGLRVDLEFMRWRVIGSLSQATAIVRDAGQANGAILVDALHLTRSGGEADDLISLPDQWLRAAQLCDASAKPPATETAVIAEAREGRLPPGGGALPLGALLDALPADTSLSVEMPMPALDPKERIATAFNATRHLLEGRPRGTRRRDCRGWA
ncbi:sugar phosphate isomerase/epimerase [Bradyrhizobium manausense]|uniref:sugar phosphate isomerase/epimerase family protein n=1 Tax=Bradyrhizobium TaxID=374 RepID=UPI001BA8B747|nr:MULTISPECIES: TIM barrel protein [Bradyrhizobium]MBR0831310.1 sugar phosphate isomerase/epimerase [Bradyrhizobium manausense]UVO26937.1 sugar phosphate isomerase/epimerase [Bradyrhizobium arachidis]